MVGFGRKLGTSNFRGDSQLSLTLNSIADLAVIKYILFLLRAATTGHIFVPDFSPIGVLAPPISHVLYVSFIYYTPSGDLSKT